MPDSIPFINLHSLGRNSIRHNLSLNRLFSKKARAITEPGKGAYWVINKGVEAGPKRVRKRKVGKPEYAETPAKFDPLPQPRGKKARLAAEAAAAAGGSSTGEPMADDDDGEEYEDDIDGNPNDDDEEDPPEVDDDGEYEPGPSRRSKKRRSESTANTGGGLAMVAGRSPPLPPTQPTYQRYPSNRYAPYPQVPAGPAPGQPAYDSRYEGHYAPGQNPFTLRGRSGVIDPGLMDRPDNRSSAPSRSSAGGGEGTPPAYPAPPIDPYAQSFPPPQHPSRSQQASSYNPNSPRMQYAMPPYDTDPNQTWNGPPPSTAPYSTRPPAPAVSRSTAPEYARQQAQQPYDARNANPNANAAQQPYTQQGYYGSEHHRVPSNGTNHS